MLLSPNTCQQVNELSHLLGLTRTGLLMNKSIIAAAVASLVSASPLSFAQSSSDIETVVVTANRFEQVESSALASITVIDREHIEATQATTALELLKSVPGITVNTLGNKGNASSIYIRGTKSKHALVLVDGVRINSPTLGGASIGLIPAFAIQSIEIVRGPRASVYGSDAIGGVIAISTISSEETHELKVGYGSEDHSQVGWRSSGNVSENTQGSFVVNKEQSDGYKIYELAADGEEFGYSAQTAFGHINHQLNDEWSLMFSGYDKSSDFEYAGQYDGSKNQQDDEFYSLSSGVIYEKEDYLSNLQFFLGKSSQATGDAEGQNAKGTITSRRNGVSWINTYLALNNIVLNAGLDYYKESADRGGSNTDNYEKLDKENKAAFLTSSFVFDPLSVELSLRHDDDSAFGGKTTWNAAAGYQISKSLQIVSSIGSAFKAPTFNDLYWPESAYDKGNPNLKPEESESAEVGLRGNYDVLNWSITAYKTEIENLINWAQENGSGKWTPSNVDDATIEGIEVAIDFYTGPINHELVAEWMDAEDKSTGDALVRIPENKFAWNMMYFYENFDLSVSALYTGERADNSDKELDAYTVVDLGIGYLATSSLKLGLRVNNAFDTDYETGYGSSSFVTGEDYYYKGPGRTAFFTGTYQF